MIHDLKIRVNDGMYNTVGITPVVHPAFRLHAREIEWTARDNGNKSVEVILRWPMDQKDAFEFKTKYLSDAMAVPHAFIISTLPLVYVMRNGRSTEEAKIQLHFRSMSKVAPQPGVWSDFPSYDLKVIAEAVKLVIHQYTGNPYGEEVQATGT